MFSSPNNPLRKFAKGSITYFGPGRMLNKYDIFFFELQRPFEQQNSQDNTRTIQPIKLGQFDDTFPAEKQP